MLSAAIISDDLERPNVFLLQATELRNANYIVHGSPWKEAGTAWPPNRLKMEPNQDNIPLDAVGFLNRRAAAATCVFSRCT